MKLLKTRTRKDLDIIADILDSVTKIFKNQHNRINDLEKDVKRLYQDAENLYGVSNDLFLDIEKLKKKSK